MPTRNQEQYLLLFFETMLAPGGQWSTLPQNDQAAVQRTAQLLAEHWAQRRSVPPTDPQAHQQRPGE
jgi:hypothetical protein